MAAATLEARAHWAYCKRCGKFEFDTRDIGHFHDEKEVSCLGCEYLAKCPTCDKVVYVEGRLKYIHLSELFFKRSVIIDNEIVSATLKLGEE